MTIDLEANRGPAATAFTNKITYTTLLVYSLGACPILSRHLIPIVLLLPMGTSRM
jgi:hypothetical protein